jgi:hypothetical protein
VRSLDKCISRTVQSKRAWSSSWETS